MNPKSLGFAVSDFEIARQLGEFFKGMMPQNLTPQNLDRVFAVGRVEAQWNLQASRCAASPMQTAIPVRPSN